MRTRDANAAACQGHGGAKAGEVLGEALLVRKNTTHHTHTASNYFHKPHYPTPTIGRGDWRAAA